MIVVLFKVEPTKDVLFVVTVNYGTCTLMCHDLTYYNDMIYVQATMLSSRYIMYVCLNDCFHACAYIVCNSELVYILYTI